MDLKYLCLVFCVNILFAYGNVDYKGYKVYNIQLQSEEQQKRINSLKSDVIDFWSKPSLKHGRVGQVMVPPSHFNWFEEKLQEFGVKIDVAVEDVFQFINDKDDGMSRTLRNITQGVFDYTSYYRYDEILDHLYRLQDSYINSTTVSLQVIEAGRTEENRTLVYLRITSRSNANVTKPVAIIEAGIIPREWVTIPASLYAVDKLLELQQSALLNDFEWIVIPVLNPDGYEYTHTNLRLWTKNRSTKTNLGFICPGVNINRNFDIDWSVSDSSSTPCSPIYAGINSFSEEESQFMLSILQEYGNRITMYFSLQNSGGFISYPWNYEQAASGMFRQHLLLGLDMVAAMSGNYSADIGFLAFGDRVSGTSSDYARNQDVMYTFNIDVIPVGNSGVMVPEGNIVSVAEDVWSAVSVVANGIYKYR